MAFQLKNSAKTGTQAVGDRTWDIYEALERGDSPKTKDFMMVLNYNDKDTVLIYGVAKPTDFVAIAEKIQDELAEVKN